MRRRRVLIKNYVREFLQREGVFAKVMSFLPIEVCVRLKVICSAKVIQREVDLRDQFEVQFLNAMDAHRCNNPNVGGHKSKLCRVISAFYERLLPFKTSYQ